MIRKALSIAGSDPSGGAGIQADLKTFSALGVYGMAAMTSLTAQNTRGVYAVQEISPEFLRAQLEAVFEDIAVHAVKIGMIGSAGAAHVLADVLAERKAKNIVLDPVMVATSGDRLISDEAIAVVKERLLPLADVITPNLREAEVLVGAQPGMETEALARALKDMGARAVLLKGGHLTQEKHSNDLLIGADGSARLFEAPRILTANTHGTGCTLSSAIAAHLAKGQTLEDSCALAKSWLTEALKRGSSLGVGHCHGPVHHFWDVWKDADE